MKRRPFDIDIDVSSSCKKDQYGIRAMVYNEETNKVLPHPSGYYLEEIPVDAQTGLASIPYEKAEEYGFIKVDLLTNTAYDGFASKADVLTAAEKEPDWKMLTKREIVEKLPHLGKHYDELQRFRCDSVESLADFLALIRPGKIHLMDEYLKNPKTIRRWLYVKPKDGIYFKKSHAISYALMIACVMNNMRESDIQW